MRTVTVKCLNCGHSKTLVVKQVKGFTCMVCKQKGTVISDAPADAKPSRQLICTKCAEELDGKPLRVIDGKIYCVKHASEIDKHNKIHNSKHWNDYKGATSWGRHD